VTSDKLETCFVFKPSQIVESQLRFKHKLGQAKTDSWYWFIFKSFLNSFEFCFHPAMSIYLEVHGYNGLKWYHNAVSWIFAFIEWCPMIIKSKMIWFYFSFISLYNTAMKIFFLASSIGTCYLMLVKFKATYDKNHDTFRYGLLKVLWPWGEFFSQALVHS